MRADPAPRSAGAASVHLVIVTLDNHLAGTVIGARRRLSGLAPGLTLSLQAASDFAADEAALARAEADIARADIVVATMLFVDEHIRAILPALEAARARGATIVACMSAGEVIRLTRMGALAMDKADKGPLALLKKLRGGKSGAGGASGSSAGGSAGGSSGAGQMAMLRRLPKILKFLPGPAQDLRAYFLTMQYWFAGSDENLAAMATFLADRYVPVARRPWTGRLKAPEPVEYPEQGIYHPDIKVASGAPISASLEALPPLKTPQTGTVGLLILRSYPLAGDADHYDGVIRAFEARGLKVIPAFASGLDARPAIEAFFMKDGAPAIDALVSLTGFSLVGGPAYNDSAAAEEMLRRLDVPYYAAQAVEFQPLERWGGSAAGFTPVESTIMVAIPELDGAIAPALYGGRSTSCGEACGGCDRHCQFEPGANPAQMRACHERAEALAAKVARMVALRREERAARKLAIVLFNFPPNSGAAGTAAFLGVYESLFNTLQRLAREGYDVTPPASIEALREALLCGNAARLNTDANVLDLVAVDSHVRREPHLKEIEDVWGPAPGRQQTDGRSLQIFGASFGKVAVLLQPPFGTEGDPMRLMFEGGFAPTHAFSAFYRWVREDFGAHAVVHFGTHGALEFMPGKQVGLSGTCWPERLIGDLPNFYLYAANNPSEATIAKRRSGAVTLSYLTPPVAQAGLYRGFTELKASIGRWRAGPPEGADARMLLASLIQDQAAALDLVPDTPAWEAQEAETRIAQLAARLAEIEHELIPEGLHVMGEPMAPSARADALALLGEAQALRVPRAVLEGLVDGVRPAELIARHGLDRADQPALESLARTAFLLGEDHELPALVHALDGGYVPPSPSGDLVRTPDILPTGRNIHGFDPFRIPSAFAQRDGALQAGKVLARHRAETGALPRTIALVLWGTDTLKTEGAPVAQALALMGARPRLDGYGRVCGAELVPLAELGRPRIDVAITLSGIFRDLLPMQTRMLAEAAWLAATADEPEDQNFIRANTLSHQQATGCDLETAALRVFSNADGAYGANVNSLIDAGCWEGEDELADAYQTRKCFAHSRKGIARRQQGHLAEVLKGVDLAYQNLDSVELGVTTIDHYVDTLGGIARAVKRARGGQEAAVYIADHTHGEGKVRTLADQVALETRARTLNPRWYEGLLKHGYEGVRQIEAQITNTLGWSATTGQVQPWVYQRISETFVLDEEMRNRLAELNPKSSVRLASRLLEAHARNYWQPDEATLEALRAAGDDLEDRLEGLMPASSGASA
jgi:magnesium chelatase subunit H